MPILRAGPWGNLTDSFQATPSSTSAELDYYPVNIAKGDWPSQNFAAYYIAAGGCSTPETVSITNAYLSEMTRTENCDYLDEFAGTPPSYYDYYTQSLQYDSGSGKWTLYWTSAFYIGEATLTNNDADDPTGTYTEYYGGPDPVVSTP